MLEPQAVRQSVQPSLEDLVIVVAKAVPRDPAARGRLAARGVRSDRRIAGIRVGYHDDGSCVGQQATRVEPDLERILEIGHLAMAAFGEPRLDVPAVASGGSGHDPREGKARVERRREGRKSRLCRRMSGWHGDHFKASGLAAAVVRLTRAPVLVESRVIHTLRCRSGNVSARPPTSGHRGRPTGCQR